MKRAILLLDGQCSPCSKVGRQIQVEGLTEDSILEIGSLHDPRYREMVDKVRPNGKLEPTLLHLDGPAVSASTGVKLVASLMRIVGLRRSFRIAQLVREATADPGFDPSRRSFLIRAASAAAVLPLAGVLGVKTATASEEETAPSPLTLAEAEAAYALLLASGEYTVAHKAAAADGVQHRRSSALSADGDIFRGDTAIVALDGLDDGQRLIGIVLTYVDGRGEVAAGYLMSAVVNATSNKVVLALHIDASEVETPDSVVVPADSVTEGLANVRGVVHDTIEVRITSPWSITRNGEDVSVELIRIVPGANLVEVDEDADLATTTHGLSGYEVTISQTDGSSTHSASGVLGPANLTLITDAALDSLVVDRDTTIEIGPPIAPPPAALSGSGVPTAPAGTLRFKGHDVDLTITNGEWSGTPLPGTRAQVPGARADHCGLEEFEVCVRQAVSRICLYCILTPPFIAVPCIVFCSTVFVIVCHVYFEFVCYTPRPPQPCPPDC